MHVEIGAPPQGSEATAQVQIQGEVTIEQIAELSQQLREAVARHSCLQVNVEAVSEVDFSFLQLMCATHIALEQQQGRLILVPYDHPPLRQMAQVTGFLREQGCSRVPDDARGRCLWLQLSQGEAQSG